MQSSSSSSSTTSTWNAIPWESFIEWSAKRQANTVQSPVGTYDNLESIESVSPLNVRSSLAARSSFPTSTLPWQYKVPMYPTLAPYQELVNHPSVTESIVSSMVPSSLSDQDTLRNSITGELQCFKAFLKQAGESVDGIDSTLAPLKTLLNRFPNTCYVTKSLSIISLQSCISVSDSSSYAMILFNGWLEQLMNIPVSIVLYAYPHKEITRLTNSSAAQRMRCHTIFSSYGIAPTVYCMDAIQTASTQTTVTLSVVSSIEKTLEKALQDIFSITTDPRAFPELEKKAEEFAVDIVHLFKVMRDNWLTNGSLTCQTIVYWNQPSYRLKEMLSSSGTALESLRVPGSTPATPTPAIPSMIPTVSHVGCTSFDAASTDRHVWQLDAYTLLDSLQSLNYSNDRWKKSLMGYVRRFLSSMYGSTEVDRIWKSVHKEPGSEPTLLESLQTMYCQSVLKRCTTKEHAKDTVIPSSPL